MRDYTIRRATLADAETIVEFNQLMAMETEDKKLPYAVISSGVKRLMQKPEYGFYLVAEHANGQTAGSCMLTMEWSDWRDGLFWWIQSVYVKAEFRKQGVYMAMYEKIQELALEAEDVYGFRLYVDKDNVVAQKTYEALGMKATDYLLYESIRSTSVKE